MGQWLADDQNLDLGNTVAIVWDAFLLFGPEATWDSAPTDLLAWGAHIVCRVPELMDALVPLLEEATETAAPTTPARIIGDRKEMVRVHYARFVAA